MRTNRPLALLSAANISAMKKSLFASVLLMICLVSCTVGNNPVPVAPVTGLPKGSNNLPWWNDSVFYEIFVRSFYDSNGDGIGDLNGLIQKLDYLNDGNPDTTDDLGITGLWLMPIHPSPSYHGYDITDYYAVNPDYGTLDDFKRLLVEAHKRDIRIIIDLVLNHTSSQYPWFQAAQDPTSEYRDWYVWSETGTSLSGWHKSPGGFYFGMFAEGMPDLNYNNPAVTAQMEDVIRFWLEEVGVDGFRLDAARHLVEEGPVQANTESTHNWYKGFRTYYKKLNPQALTVGEVWDSSATASKYVTGQDELDLVFDFDLAQAYVNATRSAWAGDASNALQRDLKLFTDPGVAPYAQFASFLTNHDQARVMTLMDDDIQKAKVAASLLLTTPGVPFIYYGEEIGLLGKKPDELIRTPMQWSAEAGGGFTIGTSWEPMNNDYPSKNVAVQLEDPTSLLAHYRTLIHLRNSHVALRSGEYLPVETCAPSVLAFLRTSSQPAETTLVIINLGVDPIPDCRFTLADGQLSGSYRLAVMLDTAQSDKAPVPITLNASGGFDAYQPYPSLVPYQTLILQFLPSKK
jgi:alpha-amylase